MEANGSHSIVVHYFQTFFSPENLLLSTIVTISSTHNKLKKQEANVKNFGVWFNLEFMSNNTTIVGISFLAAINRSREATPGGLRYQC